MARARGKPHRPLHCDRIVGMAQGRVVFDGTPDQLTRQAIRGIYGDADDDIDETLTSTLAAIMPAARQTQLADA